MLYDPSADSRWKAGSPSSAGLVVCALAALLSVPLSGHGFQFTNVTALAGILHTHSHPPNSHPDGFTDNVSVMGGGAVAEDFNNDGLLDLYVLQGGASANLLYMNQGGGVFTNEAAARGVALVHYGMGVAAADYDNDGDADILVTVRNAEPVLLENTGGGIFNVATGVIEPITLINAMSPSWGDVDNDGDLDLLLADWRVGQTLHVFQNTDNALTGVEFRTMPYTDRMMFSPRFADMNNDQRADIPAVADFENSQLYLNMGQTDFGRFTTSAGVGIEENGMGSAVGDYDNDGDLDWFTSSICGVSSDTNYWQIGNRLYRNDGNGFFTDVTLVAGVKDGNWGWGSAFGDLDNDGDLDLYHVNGWPSRSYPSTTYQFNDQPARLFENLGNGSFTNAAVGSGANDTGQGRGVLLFDCENDGDLDIFICNNMDDTVQPEPLDTLFDPGTPSLLRNDTVTSNHWLKVTLQGTPPLHRDGIGSRVYLTTGAGTQMRELHASTGFLSQGPGRIAHFGLGTNDVVDELRAEWNSGDGVAIFDVIADQALSLPSPLATVSTRRVLPGQQVTASAAAITNWVEWLVDGSTHTDPVSVSFTNTGMQDLVLNVHASEGGALLWREIIRVQVLELAGIVDFEELWPLGDLELSWSQEAARLYRIESTESLMEPAWRDLGLPTWALETAVGSDFVANLLEPAEFFRVVADPTSPWPTPE